MSENKNPTVDEAIDTAVEKIEQRQNVEAKQATSASSKGVGASLAIFLALIAIGIASYPAYLAYQDAASGPDPLVVDIERLTTRNANAEAQISSLREELKILEASQGSRANETAALEAFLALELDSIKARMGTSSQDWLYAEVEYLVRMANQRALMEGDAAGALGLLQSADKIIRDTQGLTAHGLRQALAEDIAALKSVQTPDVQGLYLELSALTKLVPALKRPLPVYQAPVDVVPLSDGADDLWSRLKRVAGSAASRFSHLIDFRRGAVEVKPLLPPRQEYYLRQNLILKIQIAQMALLDGNSPVFISALKEAVDWLDSFDPDDAATGAMRQSFKRMTQTPVASALPDISGSLDAARQQLAGFHGAQNP
jgi:uroporphyrin-3 C-methyltransferase